MTRQTKSPQAKTPRKATQQQGDDAADDTELVRITLRQVMLDEFAPPAAKAQAARTMAEINNLLGRNAKAGGAGGFSSAKPLDEMTLEELQAELAASNPANDQAWTI